MRKRRLPRKEGSKGRFGRYRRENSKREDFGGTAVSDHPTDNFWTGSSEGGIERNRKKKKKKNWEKGDRRGSRGGRSGRFKCQGQKTGKHEVREGLGGVEKQEKRANDVREIGGKSIE